MIRTLFFLVAGTFTLGSCVQLSTFQTAKTVGDGNGEILVAFGAGGVTNQFDEEGGTFGFGTFELAGRLGIGEKTDVGFKISHFSSYMVDLKYQFVGDQKSGFAMATGPGIGLYAFGFGEGVIMQGSVPLHMSIHPSEKLGIYLTPRYSGQFLIGNDFEVLHYLGGSVGFEAGRNVRFGTDISYLRAVGNNEIGNLFEDFGLGLFQVGFGVKFRIQGKK